MSNVKLPEADADGWMPWSGGENPVPGQRVDVRFRDGTVDENDPSDDWDWPWDADQRQHDIIAFRLAPTAPVEASGSGRDTALSILQAAVCSFDSGDTTNLNGVLDDILAALRPQPSGETREALDRLKMAAHVYEDDEMAADCATLEALLSARPLALGGQS